MDERSRHRHFEDQFLKQIRARAQALLRRPLPADQFTVEQMPDGIDAVRATLTRLEEYDRSLLEELPGTRTVQMCFRRRVFGPLTKLVARLRAQVLAPIEPLVANQPPGPVGREEVLDALARYDLLPHRQRPTAAVFASATGFTPEAAALASDSTNPTLILLGGREGGGWDINMPESLRRGPWAKLFELESQDERLKRLLYHLDKNVGQLESRGMSVPELAEQLGLPREQVADLVHQACRNDSRMMTVVHEGTVHLCRSPLAEESNTMSLRSWIRKLLRLKPTVGEQVREMTAQRVRLEQQRHEVDQHMQSLETDERAAFEQGRDAQSSVDKKQAAGRLMRIRRDLRRCRAKADMFTQQIDILGTHVHHLALEEQGKRVSLPKAEELTKEAAEAEQMMTELSVNADLAASIEVGAQSPMMAEEEAAIMAEFAQAAETPSSTPAKTAEPESSAGRSALRQPAASEAAPPEPPSDDDERRARPEIG